MSALTTTTTATEAAQHGRSGAAGITERLSSIAGLLAVVAGLLSLIAVSVAAILTLPAGNGQNVVAVTTGSFGVIGTVVGAYFGVKLGSDGRAAAQQAVRSESAKATVLAARLGSDEAGKALQEAGQIAPPPR